MAIIVSCLSTNIIDLSAEVFQDIDRLNIPVGVFHIGIEKGYNTPVKYFQRHGTCFLYYSEGFFIEFYVNNRKGMFRNAYRMVAYPLDNPV